MKNLLFADLLQLLLEGLQCCPIQFSFELKTSPQNLLSNTPDTKTKDGDKNVFQFSVDFSKVAVLHITPLKVLFLFSFMKH